MHFPQIPEPAQQPDLAGFDSQHLVGEQLG